MDNGSETNTILLLTQKLLDAISKKDWETYISLTDDKLSCIEPETNNNYIEGLDFHKFYFDLPTVGIVKIKENITQPTTKIYGEVAVISYRRLTQVYIEESLEPKTFNSLETRIWKKVEDGWKLVHFHRSQ
jgi:hypothetical protein